MSASPDLRTRLLPAWAALVLAAALCLCFGCDCGTEQPAEIEPAEAVEPATPVEPPLPSYDEYVLAPGDTLFVALTNLGASPVEIDRLVRAGADAYDLGRVRDGNRILYRLTDAGGFDYFRYEIDPERYFEAEPAEEGYAGRLVEIPFTLSNETLRLTLTDCLYCDAEDAGWDPNVLWQLAEDVYAWDIDFYLDIREGDTFAVLVDRKELETGVVRYGNVLGSVAIVNGELHAAARYAYTDDKGEQKSGYYDLEGNSLRRPFLRSPLKYQRVSSRFTYRRRHPILRTVRPHLGVDFAAPAGTPVRAAADGTVIFKGRNGGFGNFLKLRHANSYETWYGHLKSYAKGVNKGGRVRQGQVIAYVGSTGLSTGPHLDYRMMHRGQMVNPLTQKFLPGEPLPKTELDRFRQTALDVLVPLGLPDDAAERLRAQLPVPAPPIETPAGG